MKKILAMATLLISSASFAGSSNALPICKSLQDAYQTSLAMTCMQTVGDNVYDAGVLKTVTSVMGSYQYSRGIEALNVTKGKTYSTMELSMCESFISAYNFQAGIDCLSKSGSMRIITLPGPTQPRMQICSSPISVIDLKNKVKRAQYLLVDRSQSSIDEAAKVLQEIRASLESASK